MNENRRRRPLYMIPMIVNGICLVVFLIVGIIFLWGSTRTPDAQVNVPRILVVVFAVFDILMVMSPIFMVVLLILSIMNIFTEGTKAQRFTPLVFTVIMQGALVSLLLSTISGGGS